MKNFEACIGPLLEHEGGNDDDPQDPGGRTSRGILQSEWDEWRQTHPSDIEDVWKAPQADVLAIYRQKYWDVLRCDELPAGVDYAVFDFGVNSGVRKAAKVLQEIVGSPQDGEIGPKTIGETFAYRTPESVINSMSEERLAYLRTLGGWPRYGHGWSTRVTEVRALALKMAAASPSVVAREKPTNGLFAAILEALLGLFRGTLSKPAPAPVGVAGPVWMAWAAKEVGFHERGENRNIGRYTGPAKCGSEGDPWCAIFVNAALESSGVRGTRSAMARSFEDDENFIKLPGPAYGAITTLWRGSPSSGTGHVFFYLGENSRGILALGGNQSDQVCRQYEPRARVVGYYWPKSVALPKVGQIAVAVDADEGSET